VAPEYGWNDYEGLDVRGKTVVVMVNDPGYYTEDSTMFKGKQMTYYGRWTYKLEEAARQGAAGCLIIHEKGAAGYPWFVVQSSWSSTRLTLEPDGTPQLDVAGWLSLNAAKELTITGAGHSEMDALAEVVAKEQGRYIQPGQEPEKRYFYRSDHFNFAKKRVPALYAKGGYDHWDFGKEYARKQKDAFVATRYHQPADEYSSGDWPLGGAVQDGELLFKVGLGLATGEKWPVWKKGAEFPQSGNGSLVVL
jgi:Zn-dependent M28 family amino/carboxypeptidase